MIRVKYSCQECGLTLAEVEVAARLNEPVTDWMKQTMRSIADHHRHQSPTCPSDTCDVFIPHEPEASIGRPTIH
jgi:hypothetical protein